MDLIAVRYFVRNPNIVRTRGLYEILIERNETAIWPVRPTPGLQRAYRKGFLRPDGTATTYASSADPYVFRGDRLPRDVRGDAFVADSPTNLVHRLTIEDDGTGRLKARDAYAKGEFLASTDERFRPVNLFSAADGTLYVIDMYRGVVQDVAYKTEYLNTYIKERGLALPVGLGRIYRVTHESMRRGPRPSMSDDSPAELVEALSHPNGWWRDTAQQLLVQRGTKSAAPRLKELVVSAPDWRTKLHALWTLDGIDGIDTATVEKALGDSNPDVRAAAIRISERWLRDGEHPLRASVMRRKDDSNWIVRRQLTATLGELPRAERVRPIVETIELWGEDPVVVDAAVSGLAGQEAEVLETLLVSKAGEAKTADAVAMLSATVANSKSDVQSRRVFELSAQADRLMRQRLALLRGVDTALGGGDRGAGGFGGLAGTGGFGGGSEKLALSREPQSMKDLTAGSGEIAKLARGILERVSWPGKPEPRDEGPALTAQETARVAAGAEIYANLCANCHLENGQGNQGGRTNLAASKFVEGNPAAVMRVVLGGKDSEVGLMPPLGGSLNDEQIVAVGAHNLSGDGGGRSGDARDHHASQDSLDRRGACAVHPGPISRGAAAKTVEPAGRG